MGTHMSNHLFDLLSTTDKKDSDKTDKDKPAITTVEKLVTIMNENHKEKNDSEDTWKALITTEYQDTHEGGEEWNEKYDFLFEEAKRISCKKRKAT